MNAMSFELDISRFPIVVVRERGTLLEPERCALVEALDDLLKRRGRHALVLDLSNGTALPAPQRTYVGAHWQKNNALIMQKWAAIGVVIRPPLLTGLPTGAFWVKAAPVPAKIFPSIDEATRWVRGVLNQPQSGELPLAPSPATRAAK